MPGLIIGGTGHFVGEGWVGSGAAPGQSVAIGQVTETDTAQAIAWAPKHRLVAQVTETDTAQAITSRKTFGVAQVVETDIAQALTSKKTVAVGQVTETDIAQALASLKRLGVGQVVETDFAQVISALKKLGVVQVVETDTAQTITPSQGGGAHVIPVGQVTETDTAQAITVSQSQLPATQPGGGRVIKVKMRQPKADPWHYVPLPPIQRVEFIGNIVVAIQSRTEFAMANIRKLEMKSTGTMSLESNTGMRQFVDETEAEIILLLAA